MGCLGNLSLFIGTDDFLTLVLKMSPFNKGGATKQPKSTNPLKQRAPRPQPSLVKIETEAGIVNKNIYTNCKPHLFLMLEKERIQLTKCQVEDVYAIGFGPC